MARLFLGLKSPKRSVCSPTWASLSSNLYLISTSQPQEGYTLSERQAHCPNSLPPSLPPSFLRNGKKPEL